MHDGFRQILFGIFVAGSRHALPRYHDQDPEIFWARSAESELSLAAENFGELLPNRLIGLDRFIGVEAKKFHVFEFRESFGWRYVRMQG